MERTSHYKNERSSREKFIHDVIGYGNVIEKFYWDRGHKDGPEIHCVTDTGIIIIYNTITNRLITTLIARPAQINRYYEKEGRVAPQIKSSLKDCCNSQVKRKKKYGANITFIYKEAI